MDIVTLTNGSVVVEVEEVNTDLLRRLTREGWVAVEQDAPKPRRTRKKANVEQDAPEDAPEDAPDADAPEDSADEAEGTED